MLFKLTNIHIHFPLLGQSGLGNKLVVSDSNVNRVQEMRIAPFVLCLLSEDYRIYPNLKTHCNYYQNPSALQLFPSKVIQNTLDNVLITEKGCKTGHKSSTPPLIWKKKYK